MGQNLRTGSAKSCGCLMRESRARRARTHGMVGTPIYYVWDAMIQRCTNPKHPSWANYGGRGITVCERWLKFENFLAGVGKRPREGLSIDRKNNDGHYEPGNVRWATRTEQNNNRRPRKSSHLSATP